jgi:PIN domain nuclease of toxin-antitoxin system
MLVSVVSAYEMSLKYSRGKLKLEQHPGNMLAEFVSYSNIETLTLGFDHALLAAPLPLTHKDTFDRLLAAQSISGGVPIVTPDGAFKALGGSLLADRPTGRAD